MRRIASRAHVLPAVLAADALAMAAGAAVALLQQKHALSYLGQDGYTTYLSVAQLLIMSLLAWAVFRSRKAGNGRSGLGSGHILWAGLTAGFFFLALDQAFSIHGHIASLVVHSSGLNAVGLPVAAGDIVFGTYGLAGIALMLLYRNELRLYRAATPLLAAALLLAASVVILDVLTGEGSVLRATAAYPGAGKISWVSAIKDALTILAEGVSIALVWRCLNLARAMSGTGRHTSGRGPAEKTSRGGGHG